MTKSEKIADSLIKQSRGILSLGSKPSADTQAVNLSHEPQEAPHVMTVAQYNERFRIKGE